MRSSTKRFLVLIFSIAIFGYSAYLLFNESAAAWRTINTLKREQSERLGVRNQLIDLVSKATELLGRYEDIDRRLKPISAVLPTEPKTAEILAVIGAVASRNNLLLSQAAFEERFRQAERAHIGSAFRPSALAVKVEANFVGKYPDFKAWLREIETELRLMDVIVFNAQTVTMKEGELTMSFAVTLLAYWQPPVETITSRVEGTPRTPAPSPAP